MPTSVPGRSRRGLARSLSARTKLYWSLASSTPARRSPSVWSRFSARSSTRSGAAANTDATRPTVGTSFAVNRTNARPEAITPRTPMNPKILEPELTAPPSTFVTSGSPCPYGPTSLLLSSRMCRHRAAFQSICRRMNVGTSNSPICSRVTTHSGGRGRGTTLADAPPTAAATCGCG